MTVPKYDDLINPLLQVMKRLGGSASVSEQEDAIIDFLKLSDADANEMHRGSTTKLSYRLAWARNYLKNFGFLVNSSRGIWALTPAGLKQTSIDKDVVKKHVQSLQKAAQEPDQNEKKAASEPGEEWRNQLLEVVKKMSPDAFERLSQRLLREAGFIQVEVTGKSGDGGIDGHGMLRMAGLLSSRVLFQCKRFKGSVPPTVVRDFRGAMQGRTDKGIIITTGTFTREAKAEAQREGAMHIDLVDGDGLVEKLKEFRLGVEIKQRIVEEVELKPAFFDAI